MQKRKNVFRKLIVYMLLLAFVLSVFPADSVFAIESITLKTADFDGVSYDVVKDEDLAW